MTEPVPFIKPRLPEPDSLVQDIKRIYNNNYYSNNGPVYYEFKKDLEDYLGQNLYAVIVSNATLGLMLAMVAVFGEATSQKKYVAIPSFTFSAGPLAIRWCGYEPIFFDINAEAQPSLSSFQEVLRTYGDQLAGLLLVNDFGIGNSEIEQWEAILGAASIPCVIDSAPGFGSTYIDNMLLGGRGNCEVFSFHATKPFGIGEGGLITTKDADLAEKLESLKNFAFNANKQTNALGINAKITELDCAIGLRILDNYDATLKDRRSTYQRYEQQLTGVDVGFLPRAATAAIQFATIIVPPFKRQKVLDALSGEKIEARTYYAPAVHTFPFFEKYPKVALPNTDQLSASVVSLPVHPRMDPKTIDRICTIVRSALGDGI